MTKQKPRTLGDDLAENIAIGRHYTSRNRPNLIYELLRINEEDKTLSVKAYDFNSYPIPEPLDPLLLKCCLNDKRAEPFRPRTKPAKKV